MGGRGGSAVGVVVVAPGTSSSVGGVLGNRDVEGRIYIVTPRRAAAAAVVSAVVLRRPTKEYTHPYSMRYRRLPTAGIEVAPHYH